MWKVFVWLESSESGWQEDRWVGRCCRTNELFSHRNNFHGKIPQTIVLSPIQANIWCSFCRSVSSSSMGAIKAHIGPNIHIYMSTLHCPQCPGVHINSLQKGYIFEYPFLNHTKYFFNFLTLMMVVFLLFHVVVVVIILFIWVSFLLWSFSLTLRLLSTTVTIYVFLMFWFSLFLLLLNVGIIFEQISIMLGTFLWVEYQFCAFHIHVAVLVVGSSVNRRSQAYGQNCSPLSARGSPFLKSFLSTCVPPPPRKRHWPNTEGIFT